MFHRFSFRHSKQLKKRNKYIKRERQNKNTNLIACSICVTYFIINSYILINCLYRTYKVSTIIGLGHFFGKTKIRSRLRNLYIYLQRVRVVYLHLLPVRLNFDDFNCLKCGMGSSFV